MQEVWPNVCEWGRITHKKAYKFPVAWDFNSDAHNQVGMIITVVNQVYSHDADLWKVRGSRWIRTLGTLYPIEMNHRVDSPWSLLIATSVALGTFFMPTLLDITVPCYIFHSPVWIQCTRTLLFFCMVYTWWMPVGQNADSVDFELV